MGKNTKLKHNNNDFNDGDVMVNLKPGEYLRRMTFHLVTQTARTKNIRVIPTYLT